MDEHGAADRSSATPNAGPDDAASTRRSLLKKGAVGAAVAWTAPTVLSAPAFAGTSPVVEPPVFVSGSAATGYSTASTTTRTVNLTSNNVAAGDLWMAIVSYDQRANINLPGGAGWTVTPANDSGTGIYSVRSYVLWRILTAGDISGGSFTGTFTSNGNDLTYGGLRGGAVAYRGTNLTAAVTQAAGTGSNSGDNRTSQFPANPSTAPNIVLRLGAARGYGGWFSFSSNIDWTAWPGTARVDYNSANEGDRATIIAEQIDDGGAQANGTWYRQFAGANNNTTFTAAITNL